MVRAVVVGVTAAGMSITASFPPLRYQPHWEQRVWVWLQQDGGGSSCHDAYGVSTGEPKRATAVDSEI